MRFQSSSEFMNYTLTSTLFFFLYFKQYAPPKLGKIPFFMIHKNYMMTAFFSNSSAENTDRESQGFHWRRIDVVSAQIPNTMWTTLRCEKKRADIIIFLFISTITKVFVRFIFTIHLLQLFLAFNHLKKCISNWVSELMDKRDILDGCLINYFTVNIRYVENWE